MLAFFSHGQHGTKVQILDSLVIKRGLKIGASSLHLGSFNSATVGQQNFIYTTGGPLRINWGIGPGTQNTYINPYWGRVGLGTADPKERVQIGEEMTFHDGGTKYFARNAYYHNGDRRLIDGPAMSIRFGTTGRMGLSISEYGFADSLIIWKEALWVNSNGRVGIYSSNPKGELQVNLYDLDTNRYGMVVSVPEDRQRAFAIVNRSTISPTCLAGEDVFRIRGNGLVEAKEICLFTDNWCDYVFSHDYPLMPLGELRVFIKENGHLPKIPSESKVIEEGQNLGEMNKLLLEKVEELTLYTLQQQAELEALAEELRKLKEEKR